MSITVSRAGAILVLFVTAASLAAQVPQQLYVVDFEGLAEGTPVSTQYAADGVAFSIDGNPAALPVIAVEGAPTVAFQGSGLDSPMASGSGGLTDPVVGTDPFAGQDIRLDFAPPITSLRLYVADIDGSESFTVSAFSGSTLVDSQTRSAGQAGTGNGVSSEFFVSGASITSVRIDVPTSAGFAVDFVSFTRPCSSPTCLVQYRIAQESAPGAGDFDANVLGFLLPYPASVAAATFYAYDVPEGASWNGASLTPVADRSHLLLADTTDGLSLVVVHDRAIPDDPDGGMAETRVEVVGDQDGLVRTVEDDPAALEAGSYMGAAGSTVFTAAHAWSPCCTDGFVLSGLDGEWALFTSFEEVDGNPATVPIQGLSEWVAYSADGSELPLVLAAGRRVRIDVAAGFICQTDLGFAGPTGVLDLSICGDDLATPGGVATFQLQGAPPLATVYIAVGPFNNPTTIAPGTVLVPVPWAAIIDSLSADASGVLSFPIPGGLLPMPLYIQCGAFVGAPPLIELSNAVAIE